jgi:hypothetical protein
MTETHVLSGAKVVNEGTDTPQPQTQIHTRCLSHWKILCGPPVYAVAILLLCYVPGTSFGK